MSAKAGLKLNEIELAADNLTIRDSKFADSQPAKRLADMLLRVSAREIQHYDRISRAIRSLSHEREQLRDKFLQAHNIKAPIAKNGIYRLVFSEIHGYRKVDWEQVACDLAKEHFGNKWKTWRKQVEAEATLTPGYTTVTTEPNPKRIIENY